MQKHWEAPLYPMQRDDPLHPPNSYRDLREHGPVVDARMRDTGKKVWLVTRYQEAMQVLLDTRFSSDCTRSGFPVKRTPSALIRMDPPDHTKYRRMLSSEFTKHRMSELEPVIQDLTDRLIDDMVASGQAADLVHALARPLPSLVICHLLGVPDEDHEFLQDQTTEALRTDATDEEIDAAVNNLGAYMQRVVFGKLGRTDDDILCRLLNKYHASGECSLETAADLARLLLVAGHVTTVNMIGIGLLTLLENSDQLTALRSDLGGIEGAVEELLRFLSITATLARVASTDLEIGGTAIKEGDGVLILLSSANRDRLVFDRPDAFDLTRENSQHLAFGWGPHICLGAPLARLELQAVFSTLLRRFPTIILDTDFSRIPFREKVLIYGVQSLPIRWSYG